MLVVDDAWRRQDPPRGSVGTIGNFDGLHLGQRRILESVVGRAGELGLPAAVVTFDPHPLAVLDPQRLPRRLTTPEQKRRLLEEAGVEILFDVRFTAELARTAAEDFVVDFLHGRLEMREIFVGRRFAFGRQRGGDLALLERLGEGCGFRACGVDEVLLDGEPISSTRIRRLVEEGRVEEAARMLGRPYALTGRVVAGDGRGRRIGWPTANLAVDNELLPANGVYAGSLRLMDDPRWRIAVSNVGVRPTFDGGSERVVESHLLDFDADLYGRRVELRLSRRLRAERRFGSIEELTAQIARDVEATREYFAGSAC